MSKNSKKPGRSVRAKAKRPPVKPAAEAKTGKPPLVIVGIGASAGGVEALGRFFDAMAADSGAAFVVVLHLDPTRESHMASVLGSHTSMAVVQVKDGTRIAPGHVYVIAPDKDLIVRGGTLHLSAPSESRGHRHPVDVLFRSLAEDQGERSIAIVLSGTGSNGTDGLKEVKATGGLIVVQDPATAKFDGMPRSAISAGMADHILPPEAMPDVLLRYLRHEYIATPAADDTATPVAKGLIDQILVLLRARGGHDFGNYKRSTLQRRIQRRLGLRNVATLAEYFQELRANADEVQQLVKDLMINVTGFFRDPEGWKALADLVIRPLVAERENGASIRAWVPGCSTGEEAYSLAILIAEMASAAGKQFEVKIFATDTREDNLSSAREGIYPEAALATFKPARLRQFFNKLDGTYQVKKELRGMVVLAAQNLLRDPPFSRLDIVSCRNLLIYLEPEAQQRIIALCHFALREGGHLFLGSSETVGRHDALFETVSKKWRIYRRLGPTRHDIVKFPVLGERVEPHKASGERFVPKLAEPAVQAAEVAKRALLERFVPASVLIDRNARVLYFHGPTGDYLEQPTGEPSKDLFVMARQGLAPKLRAAIHEAMTANRGVTFDARVRQKNANRAVTVTVTPVAAGSGANLLVSFESERSAAPAAHEVHETLAGDHALQDELKAARAELQSTTELMESANEELKASNEEITSMNEELQSTNEELETSKEEMQSFNEELHTVNNQLQHKVRELEDKTNDLNNLLEGAEVATLFLDLNLCVKWFTPATEALFNFAPSDIGRPIAHFARKFADENLLADAEEVLRKLTTIEAEVPGEKGRWYARRMLPYRTHDNRIVGVVVAFFDVTETKHASDAINESRLYAEGIVETIRQPLLVLDEALRVVSANTAFQVLFQISQNDVQGQRFVDLGNGEWDIPRLRALLDELLATRRHFNDIEVLHEFRGLGERCMLLNGRMLARGGGRDALILLAIEDITERRRAEKASRRLAAIVEFSQDAITSIDLDGTITSWNSGAEKLYGYSAQEMIGETLERLVPEERSGDLSLILERLRRGESTDNYETVRRRADGNPVWISLTVFPIRNPEGKIVGASGIARDMTERKRIEEAVRRSEAQYRMLFNSIDEGFCVIEKVQTAPGEPSDFRYMEVNPGFDKQTGVGGVVGKTIREAFPAEPNEWLDKYDAVLRDGDPIHFEADFTSRGRFLELSAFRVEDGTGRRVAVIFRDITARKHAEALAHRLAAIVEGSEDAIISKNLEGMIVTWNRGAERLFGFGAKEAIGRPITMLFPPAQQGEERGIMERIRRGDRMDTYESIRLRKDGSPIWVSLSISPLKDGGGQVIGASTIVRDMTERRRAEEHRDILVRELNHRAKNSLAMIQAIATQTFGRGASLPEAKLNFEDRLMALARGHDLLTQRNWTGTDLESVVKAAIEPLAGGGSRFRIEGPVVPLTPAAALTFTLALHELCTNAVKYGALSSANGRVDIGWGITGNGEARRLELTWKESGGPAVKAPVRKGFGSRLVEHALAQELGGEVRINYEASGIVCTVDAPLPTGQTEANVRWMG